MMRRRLLAVMAAGALGALAIAAPANAARGAKNDPGLDISSDGGGISINGGGSGGSLTIGGNAPKVLKGFPLPPGSKVLGGFEGSDNKHAGAFETVAVKGKVKSWGNAYISALKKKGYKITNKYTAALNGKNTITFTFKKGKQKGALTAADDTNTHGYKSALTITLST